MELAKRYIVYFLCRNLTYIIRITNLLKSTVRLEVDDIEIWQKF